MNFKEHLANYVLGRYGYSDLIQVAIAGLLDGYESTHLAILAGENEKSFNVHDLNRYFELALNELNIKLPSSQQAAKTMVAYWITQIFNGDVFPIEGIRHIIYDVYHSGRLDLKDSQYAGDALDIECLYGLYYAYDDLNEFSTDPEYARYSREEGPTEIVQQIIAEAKNYYAKYVKP
jgi:hypothetical protein